MKMPKKCYDHRTHGRETKLVVPIIWASSWDYGTFILCKILQTCMRSHPVGLVVWFLVEPFIYFHTSCVRTGKALARLRRCAGSPEPSLVTYVVSTIISWTGWIFVFTTYVIVPFRTALSFGKFYNIKFDRYTIICDTKLLSFGINYFLII